MRTAPVGVENVGRPRGFLALTLSQPAVPRGCDLCLSPKRRMVMMTCCHETCIACLRQWLLPDVGRRKCCCPFCHMCWRCDEPGGGRGYTCRNCQYDGTGDLQAELSQPRYLFLSDVWRWVCLCVFLFIGIFPGCWGRSRPRPMVLVGTVRHA